MANLSTKQWVRYEPNIPGNLELPVAERFYLEVRAGLSTLELQAMRSGVAEVVAKDAESRHVELAAKLDGVVRMGAEPLSLEGVPVEGLAGYLAAVSTQVGMPLVTELFTKVNELNSWDGVRALFSVRPSGGGTGTASTSTEPAGPLAAAR